MDSKSLFDSNFRKHSQPFEYLKFCLSSIKKTRNTSKNYCQTYSNNTYNNDFRKCFRVRLIMILKIFLVFLILEI